MGAVDVALQRRCDLIPNLVETVKGFAARNRSLQEHRRRACRLRRGTYPDGKDRRQRPVEQRFSRLLVVSENYPQLQSNENFLRLQDELAGTENRIAAERRKYNDALQRYNTDIELFPKNIVAGMSGFARNDAYFKTEARPAKFPR